MLNLAQAFRLELLLLVFSSGFFELAAYKMKQYFSFCYRGSIDFA